MKKVLYICTSDCDFGGWTGESWVWFLIALGKIFPTHLLKTII